MGYNLKLTPCEDRVLSWDKRGLQTPDLCEVFLQVGTALGFGNLTDNQKALFTLPLRKRYFRVSNLDYKRIPRGTLGQRAQWE